MLTPLDIERLFQDLKHLLSFPASPRQRLFGIGRFLTALNNSAVPKESYLIELAEYLPNIIAKVDLDGCDPENVRSLYEQMRVFESYGLDTNVIRLAAVLLFAYAGDVVKAVALLGNENLPDSSLDTLAQIQNIPNLTSFERLQKAIDECKDERIRAALKAVEERWSSNITPHDNTITVPVVEHPFVKSLADKYESSLRRIRIEVLARLRPSALVPKTEADRSGFAGQGKDEIHADVAVFGAETNAAEIIAAPITAARNLVNEKHSDIAKRFVAGHLLFEGDHALHEGCSANLGIALLTYCAILRSTLQREQYHILPTVAVSGAIDDKGNVQPVEAATLPNKVKGAFFSWTEILIVPKQQIAVAEEALRSLAEKYPRRTLTLIGIANMREVFFDRRLAERIRVPFLKHAARKMWKWRTWIAGLIIILLGVALWFKFYGPLDKNPVGYKFEGEMLILKNKSGETVDKILVGEASVPRANQIDITGYAQKYVALYDIDKDGTNEVFWLQHAEGHSTVNCKFKQLDTPRWSVLLQKTLQFPRKTDIAGKNFRPEQMLVGDFDNDGIPEVFVTARLSPFFPGVLFKFDAATGNELAHYVHIGPFADMEAVDLDSDGVQEILLCGGNKSFQDACVVIIDPRFVGGHSPVRGDYFLEGYKPAAERAYIRIPPTVVGNIFLSQTKGNTVKRFTIERSISMFRFFLLDAYIGSSRIEERISSTLIGYFRFDLSVKDFGSSDDFDTLYDRFVKEGRVPKMRRDEYLRQYKMTMLYWDGETWQDKPVKNKWYEEALKKMK